MRVILHTLTTMTDMVSLTNTLQRMIKLGCGVFYTTLSNYNKKMKNYIAGLIIFFLVIGCQHIDYVVIDSKSDSSKVLNLDQIFEYQPYTINDLIDTINVIALETNSASILSSIELIEMLGNYIIIQDRYQNGSIAIFDINGKFIRRLNQGNGPGEINTVTNFDVDEHFLYTLQSEKVNKYSLSGDFIDSYPVMAMHNTLFDCIKVVDDGFLLAIYPCDSKSGKYEVLHTDKDFNAKRQFVFDHSFVGYNSNNEFRGSNNNVIFFPSMCNTVYQFDNNSFKPLYVLNYPKYENTFESKPDCWSSGLDFLQKHCSQNKFFTEGRLFQASDYLYLTFFDGFGHLVRIYLDTINGKYRSGYYPSFDKDAPIWLISYYGFVMCTYKDYFVHALPPDAYLNVPKGYDAPGNHLIESVSQLQHISDEDKQKILNAKDDDNPLIIMYKLKGIE